MPTKITAAQARQLASVDVAVKQLQKQLETAEQTRRELFGRFETRIPLSEDETEAKKGIRVAVAGGYKIRVTPKNSGRRFSLTDYLEKGGKITAAMQRAISPGTDYSQWTIKDTRGPLKPGSVEPA